MLKWVGGKSCFEITDDSVRGVLAIVWQAVDFYSFTLYEFLISSIQFSLVKMVILDIGNWITTRNNYYV